MDKLLHSFITIEKSIQIATLVGLMLFLGYLGFMNSRSDRPIAPTTPLHAPSTSNLQLTTWASILKPIG